MTRIYKLLVILDDDNPRIVPVSANAILEFFSGLKLKFSDLLTPALLNVLQRATDALINDNTVCKINNYNTADDFNYGADSRKGLYGDNSGKECVEDMTNSSPNEREADGSVKSYNLIDDICAVLNMCSNNSSIIISELFKVFIQTDPIRPNKTKPVIQSISAIDLLLQPIDSSLLYVPRASRQYLDIELTSGQSVLWKFHIENEYDINFGIFVYTCESESSDIQGPDEAIKRGKLIMSNFMKKTDGLTNIDMTSDNLSQEFGRIRVLEPLTRIHGSVVHEIVKKNHTKDDTSTISMITESIGSTPHMMSSIIQGWEGSEIKQLQSSQITSQGFIEGSYDAKDDLLASEENSSINDGENIKSARHICRFIFDNTLPTLNICGKYIDFIIQVVDEASMIAATTAAQDHHHYMSQPRSNLYSQISNSKSIEFLLDGPWDIDVTAIVKNESEGNDNIIKVDEESTQGHTMIPLWVSTLGSIPLAGSIMMSVTDRVAKLLPKDRPGVSSVASVIDQWIPQSIKNKLGTVKSESSPSVISEPSAIIAEKIVRSSSGESDRFKSYSGYWQSYDSVDASTSTNDLLENTVHYTNNIMTSVQVEDESSAIANIDIVPDDSFTPQPNTELLMQIDKISSELNDYKQYCLDLRKRCSDLQTRYNNDNLSCQQTINHQTELIQTLQSQIARLNADFQQVQNQFIKARHERKALKNELLNLRKLGVYDSITNSSDVETKPAMINYSTNEDKEAVDVGIISDIEPEKMSIDSLVGRPDYSSSLTKLRTYRDQHRSLHELLTADPDNPTLLAMAEDIENMIKHLQKELAKSLLH